MDCILLAGGFGTRLQKKVPDVPKPLAPILHTPFLEILLKQLQASQIINRVIFSLGYKAQMIKDYVLSHKYDFEPVFTIENTPLGTGGAIKQAMQLANTEIVFAMNGDSYLDINFNMHLKFHIEKQALASIACKTVKNVARFGTVVTNSFNEITSFLEKQEIERPGLINGGIYCFHKKIMEYFPSASSFSLERDVFPNLKHKGLFSYPCSGIFIDIGTDKSYTEAQQTLKFLAKS